MKYLKTFENNELKKYIILHIIMEDHSSSDFYLLLKKIKKYKSYGRIKYKLEKLYKTDQEKGFRPLNDEHLFAFSQNFIDEKIVYQSDNLEQLILIMQSIYETEKYNL